MEGRGRGVWHPKKEEPPTEGEDIAGLLAPFPRQRTYLLPALQAVQRRYRYLPDWAMKKVGYHLHVPKSEVYGVACSYPLFRFSPPGLHVIRVCTGLPCQVNGASKLLRAFEDALDLRCGQTSADGRFTLEHSPCCFVCGVAPAVEVDESVLGRLDEQGVEALVAELRNSADIEAEG